MSQTKIIVSTALALFLSSSFLLFGADADVKKCVCQPVDLLKNAKLNDFDFFLIDNGKKEDAFSITADGVLHLTGEPKGWLGTKKEYRNFILTSEFRYPDPEIKTNSGLLVRIGEQKTTTFLPHCVEIQLQTGDCGTLYAFHDFVITGDKTLMKSYANHEFAGNCESVVKFRDAQNYEKLSWNKIEIHCNEDLLIVKINGKVVNWAIMAEIKPGKIAFQSEGGPIEFRNAYLTVLP